MKDYPTLKSHAELLAAQADYNELFCATKNAHKFVKLYLAEEFNIDVTVAEAKEIQEIIEEQFGSCGHGSKEKALKTFRFKSINSLYPHQQA